MRQKEKKRRAVINLSQWIARLDYELPLGPPDMSPKVRRRIAARPSRSDTFKNTTAISLDRENLRLIEQFRMKLNTESIIDCD